MEEKTVCQSTNKGAALKLVVAICFLVAAIALILIYYPKYSDALDEVRIYWNGYDANEYLYKMGSRSAVSAHEYHKEHEDYYNSIHTRKNEAQAFLYVALGCFVIAIISLCKWIHHGRTEITVTNKRIYGNAAFGKEVDLPLSSIVMIHKGGNKKIIIATSAGKVHFVGVKNRDEVYSAIQTLLAVR